MRKYKPLYKILGIGIFFLCSIWLAGQIKDVDVVQQLVRQFSYAGVFILALISGFNVIVPIPAMSFLPVFLAAGLHGVAVVATISIGMTCGDGVGYLLGKYGREMITRSSLPPWVQKTELLFTRHKYGLPVFLFLYASFMPLPNELVVIPAGATGLRWWLVLVPIFLGNIILNTLIALGVSSIFM